MVKSDLHLDHILMLGRDLKRRIRKIPGVPIVSVAKGKYVIERLPDVPDSR